jgi:hypothetical protein
VEVMARHAVQLPLIFPTGLGRFEDSPLKTFENPSTWGFPAEFAFILGHSNCYRTVRSSISIIIIIVVVVVIIVIIVIVIVIIIIRIS